MIELLPEQDLLLLPDEAEIFNPATALRQQLGGEERHLFGTKEVSGNFRFPCDVENVNVNFFTAWQCAFF